jgi:hypothetical protein
MKEKKREAGKGRRTRPIKNGKGGGEKKNKSLKKQKRSTNLIK